jgi:hypothetical protein
MDPTLAINQALTSGATGDDKEVDEVTDMFADLAKKVRREKKEFVFVADSMTEEEEVVQEEGGRGRGGRRGRLCCAKEEEEV